MQINFATSDTSEAEKRIRQVEPDMPNERVERFVQAIRDGLVTVGDPAMYPNGIPIYPTTEGQAMGSGLIELLAERDDRLETHSMRCRTCSQFLTRMVRPNEETIWKCSNPACNLGSRY